MTASVRHTQQDWVVYQELGAGELALVNVAEYSPAWYAKLRNGTWITEIDGKSFDDFEKVGAPVGTAVVVKGFHAKRGHFETSIALGEKPKVKRSPRSASRARVPHAESGRVIARIERPKWLTALATAKYLSPIARALGSFLCNRAINNHGFTDRWSYQTLAEALGVSRATIQRAIAELRQAGFLKVQSGAKARRVNRYGVTWPVSEGTPVVVSLRARSSSQSAANF
jgi:membrane-associated protease RseP (regulator of RpoE activity)